MAWNSKDPFPTKVLKIVNMSRFDGTPTAKAIKCYSIERMSKALTHRGGQIRIQARGYDTRYLCNLYAESTSTCRMGNLCRCRMRVCDTCVYRPQQLFINLLQDRTTYVLGHLAT